MATRAEDDPRNNEPGERGPGGVRMVVVADLCNQHVIRRFSEQMKAPGSPMFEEISKMKVGIGGGGG
jgi:hypothetical protein